MEELPQSPIDRASRVVYYEQMENDGLNMVRHARLHLGWLAMGSDMLELSPDTNSGNQGGAHV